MKNIHIFMTLLLVIICLQAGMAHPPADVQLDFNKDSKVLTVTSIHPVKDTAEHIVNKIEVKVNGETMVEQHFLSQQDGEKQVVPFLLQDLKPGDKVDVTAHCNVFGKKKVSMIVEDE